MLFFIIVVEIKYELNLHKSGMGYSYFPEYYGLYFAFG